MFISQETIGLNANQLKFIESGWGSDVVNKVITKKISYSSGGVTVDGYFSHPKDISISYPLVIWNRGGNHKSGLIDEFLASGLFGEIASWGYVVLASQYRKDDEFGGKEVDDVMKLLEIADDIPFCDTENIGMEGWSRGGMMAYLALTRTSRIKCSVIVAGIANLMRNESLNNDFSLAYSLLFGSNDSDEFTKRKKDRSAVYFSGNINRSTSILFIHGTEDEKVSYLDSIDMYNLMSKNNNGHFGAEYQLALIPDGDHYLKNNRAEVNGLRRNWFDKHLKSKITT